MAIKKGMKKNALSIRDLQNKISPNMQHAKSFYNFSKPLQEVTGVTGIPKSGIGLIYGHSNTGKTTIMLDIMRDVIEQGDLPVLILTENKFSWDYAVNMGIHCELDREEYFVDEINQETGEIVKVKKVKEQMRGDFLVKNDFEYVEETFEFMKDIMKMQRVGVIQQNICFFYDSIGSLGSKYEQEGGKKMAHLASVVGTYMNTEITSRINSSLNVYKNREHNYQATAVFIARPSVTMPSMGMPQIKPKSSSSIYLAASLVIRTGGVTAASTKKLKYEYQKNTISYGLLGKITIPKNHINGLEYEDKRFTITPHGIIGNEKTDIDAYKKQYKKYFADQLKVAEDDFDLLVDTVVEDE